MIIVCVVAVVYVVVKTHNNMLFFHDNINNGDNIDNMLFT